MDPELQTLGMQLADALARNTASSISTRIRATKSRKRDQETIGELEGIVNDLVADKNELARIAQSYEQQLVAQSISSDDVEYITTSIVPVLRRLIEMGSPEDDSSSVDKVMDVLEPVISVETVTVLQLLGFNFKQAIGEPLTELLRNSIASQTRGDLGRAADLQVLTLQRDVLSLQIAQDEAAFQRLSKLSGETSSA